MNGIGASPKESCGRSVMGTTPSLGNLGRNDLGLRVPVAKVREQLPSDVGHARALQELDLLSVHGHAGAARRARTVGRAVPETEHAAALDDRVVEQHAQVVHRYLLRSSGEFDAPSHASARSHQLLPRQGVDYLRQRRLGHPCRLGDLRDLQPRRSRPRDQSQTGCRDSNLSCEHGVVRWGVRAEQFASEDAIAGRHGIALDIRKTCAPECLCQNRLFTSFRAGPSNLWTGLMVYIQRGYALDVCTTCGMLSLCWMQLPRTPECLAPRLGGE